MRTTILSTITILVFAAMPLHAQVVPGYLGKKNIFTYEYQTVPNFSDEMIDTRGIGVLQVLFKNRHFLGYERVLSLDKSIKIDLGYATPTFLYWPFDYSEIDIETNEYGMIVSRNLSLGIFYRNYSFLSPLSDYVSYGARIIRVSTPGGTLSRGSEEFGDLEIKNFQAESKFTGGLFLQFGKTRVIKDLVFIDSYLEIGVTYYDIFGYFENLRFDMPIDKAMGRTFRYNLLNVGVSIGLMN